MKKQTKILIASLLILTGVILARPFVHISEGVLFYRDSMAEKYTGIVLWR
jgi:hypothetical protein